jgi:hypothetical protein
LPKITGGRFIAEFLNARAALDCAISGGRPAVVDVQSDVEALAPNAWEG